MSLLLLPAYSTAVLLRFDSFVVNLLCNVTQDILFIVIIVSFFFFMIYCNIVVLYV